jgi:hypothetical protein
MHPSILQHQAPRTSSAPDLSPVADMESQKLRQRTSTLAISRLPKKKKQNITFHPIVKSSPMKIIIIGAGLSGLTTALALHKYVAPKPPDNEPLEIKIYDESTVKPSGTVEYSWRDHSDIRNQQKEGGRKKNQGAAISLQSNAFKVLRELDANLAEPCPRFWFAD